MLLLGAGCVSDLQTRRIPNSLVLVIAALGIARALVVQPWPDGAIASLAGLGVGLALWLPFWFLRMLGAGDVKYFAAGAAWLGAGGAVEGALLAAFAGGVVSLGLMIFRHGMAFTAMRLVHGWWQPAGLRNEPHNDAARRVPYALAMAAGLLLAAWRPGVLL
ncbi:MAG: A24 family peptidase [Longimicrobiales bacterium]